MLEVLTLVLMVYLILGLHELGHFLALRRYGVRVEVFALGGPPGCGESASRRWSTAWAWCPFWVL